MKRTIGIILLIIGGLNCITVFTHLSQNKSPGSPIYLILLVMMLVGGYSLTTAKKKDDGSNFKEIEKKK